MGRTAKYKKIKSFDPYSKQNGGRLSLETVGIWGLGDVGRKAKRKSKTVEKLKQQKLNRIRKKMEAKGKPLVIKGKEKEGFDLVPSDNEDDFDLDDLTGSLKKQKPMNPSKFLEMEDEFGTQIKGVTSTTTTKTVSSSSTKTQEKPLDPIKEAEAEAREAEKLLKLDKNGGNNTSVDKKAPEGRRENESKRAYNRRVKAETRQIIKNQQLEELNPEKRRKKKEFLTQKKKRKRSKGQSAVASGGGSDDEERKFQRQENIPFGTQVERPPTFTAVPRGASKAKATGKNDRNSKNNKKSGFKSDAQIEAEQRNLERMRQKVQEQYALIKAKRKRAGDFHL
jgi:hypothetical protein